MNDGFEVPISFLLDKSGAVDADKLLQQIRTQVKGVSDETKAYNEWLAKNAKELGAVSTAQAEAAAELERYQATLEKMHQAQVLETAEKKNAVKWTQSHKEGTADLSKTLDSLKDNVKKSTEASEKDTEATDKSFASKKQLKDMLKQLGHEFPLLGSIGRLALNPIAFASAGIVAAFTIWKTRTDELTRSLGGVALPNIGKDHLDMLDEYAKRFGRIVDGVDKAKTKLKELQDQIDANAEFAKALGIDVGTGPAKEKADLASRLGSGLVASGQAKMRDGSPISAKELADLKTLASAAEEDTASRQSRIEDIDQLRGMASWDPRRLFYDNRFRMRYGYGTSYDEAVGIEQSAIASNNNVKNYYGAMTQRAALFAVGQSEVKEGQDILGNNVAARRSIGNQDAAAFMKAFEAVDVGNLATVGPKITAMAQALIAMVTSVEKANQELARKQAAQSRKP